MTKLVAGLFLVGAVLGLSASLRAQEDEKPIKADVTIKDNAKSGKAKAGQMVEFQVQYPVVPPMPSDFVVTVDGEKVKVEERSKPVLVDGKPTFGSGIKALYLKAKGNGKQKVVIEYKKGDEKKKKEVELEVTN